MNIYDPTPYRGKKSGLNPDGVVPVSMYEFHQQVMKDQLKVYQDALNREAHMRNDAEARHNRKEVVWMLASTVLTILCIWGNLT